MAELQLMNPQRRYHATAQRSGYAERIFHFRVDPLGSDWSGTQAFEAN